MSINNNNNENNIEQEQNRSWWKIVGLKHNLKVYIFCTLLLLIIGNKTFADNTYIPIPKLEEYDKLQSVNLHVGENKEINLYMQKVKDMNIPRTYMHLVKLSNNKVLIIGGRKLARKSIDNEELNSAEIYDIEKQSFKIIQNMKHSECITTYTLDNGKVLLLSKKLPCQIYNPITETFEIIFPGISELPDIADEIYTIKESENSILVSSNSMEKIIRININTGKYTVIYSNKNKKIFASVPINNDEILFIENTENKENRENINNSNRNIKHCNINIYRINKNKMKTIGNIDIHLINDGFAPCIIKLLLLSPSKVLLYFSKEFGVNNENYDCIIDFTKKPTELKQSTFKSEWAFGNRQAYLLDDNLVYFSTGQLYDIEKNQVYKISFYDNFVSAYFTTYYSTYGELLKISENTLLKIGGRVGQRSKSNTHAAIISITKKGNY